MSEIPQDIIKRAAELHAELNVLSYKAFVPDEGFDLIEQALLAHERETIEQCAKIARDRHEFWHAPHRAGAWPHGEVCDDISACSDIAAAIQEAAR